MEELWLLIGPLPRGPDPRGLTPFLPLKEAWAALKRRAMFSSLVSRCCRGQALSGQAWLVEGSWEKQMSLEMSR